MDEKMADKLVQLASTLSQVGSGPGLQLLLLLLGSFVRKCVCPVHGHVCESGESFGSLCVGGNVLKIY